MIRLADILRSTGVARSTAYVVTAAVCALGAIAVDLTLELRLPLGDARPPAIVRTLCAIAAIIIASEATRAFDDFAAALTGDVGNDEPPPFAVYLQWPIATAAAAFAAGIALRGWPREVVAWF